MSAKGRRKVHRIGRKVEATYGHHFYAACGKRDRLCVEERTGRWDQTTCPSCLAKRGKRG